MAPGRIRVFIAGSVHVNRTLVRRYLEDDGYEVVGEELTRENLAASIRRSEPDAVVLDDGLLGRGMMARVRRAAPDAKVIVFTDSPTTHASPPGGADGYLEKGVGLAALTSLIVRLFTDEPALVSPPAVLAAAGGTSSASSSRAGAIGRLVTVAGGAVLIVWGLIAMIATGGVTPPPADTTDTTQPRTVVAAGSLEQAYDALDGLVDALRGGNYVLATIQAQTLMDERQQAITEGYSLSGFDAAISVRLDGLVGGLPQRVNTSLSGILRSLYPTLPDEDQPGGGSGVVLGPSVTTPADTSGETSGGSGAGDGTSGGSGAGDGTSGGGASGGDGNGGGPVGAGKDGGGGGDGDASGGDDEGHGNGNAWGHSKHESDGESEDHGNGNAWGHDEDHHGDNDGDEHGHSDGGPPSWSHGNGNGHHHDKKAKSHNHKK